MTILFAAIYIGASIVFWLGCAADAKSSKGRVEKTKIFQGKGKIFELRKYVLWMLAMYGLSAAIAIYGLMDRSEVWTGAASALMVLGGIIRFKQATKNYASRKIDGLGK